jgi:hypothetical protein
MNYLRREAGIRKAQKVLAVWRATVPAYLRSDFADDGPIAQRLLRTRVPCSGPCCGNPRRWWGEKTRQERRMEEVDWAWGDG